MGDGADEVGTALVQEDAAFVEGEGGAAGLEFFEYDVA